MALLERLELVIEASHGRGQGMKARIGVLQDFQNCHKCLLA
jgi:hypothetical protein